MTSCEHIAPLLQDYLDGTLTPDRRQVVAAHLDACAACRAEEAALASVHAAVDALPRSLPPPHDLWSAIEARLRPTAGLQTAVFSERPRPARTDRRPVSLSPRPPWATPVAVLVVLLIVGTGALWLATRLTRPAWEVARLEGTPRIDAQPLTDHGRLRRGGWLETDAHSRAALDVGAIGRVEVAPGTRLQLVDARPTDHRIALTEGAIHARIWAPPRLFFVETPSALAIDLGCEYTLAVDTAGGALLHVTMGYVALEHPGRTTVVPAGSRCRTRPGRGPGTPFDEDASPAFADALARLDFDDGPGDALDVLLAEARPEDAATLWNLLYRLDGIERARCYDRLAALVRPPEGVQREAVLRAEPAAVDAWHMHLGLDLDAGWLFRKPRKKPAPAP